VQIFGGDSKFIKRSTYLAQGLLLEDRNQGSEIAGEYLRAKRVCVVRGLPSLQASAMRPESWHVSGRFEMGAGALSAFPAQVELVSSDRFSGTPPIWKSQPLRRAVVGSRS